MKTSFAPNLSIALAHYPVVNKNKETIASAVTNLDLHDIARAARTYGLERFFVVTPLEDQQRLVQRIVDHWTEGAGGAYNPSRRRALELIRIEDRIEDAVDRIERESGAAPRVIATCARSGPVRISFGKLRADLGEARPHLLVFGTAWGLDEAFLASAHDILEPVQGGSDYNHLSVRSAVAIILDRLLGPPR